MNKKTMIIIVSITIIIILVILFNGNKKNGVNQQNNEINTNVEENIIEDEYLEDYNQIRYDPMIGKYVDSVTGRVVDYKEQQED